MCAQSSQTSTDDKKSLISRAWSKIPPIVQPIAATNRVLESLAVYQLSSFFKHYRICLFTCLNHGKLILNEYEFHFSEYFLKYFQSGNLESLYLIDGFDPIAVTRIKKLFNVLLTAEKFLLKLEKHESINAVSVYNFFSELKQEAHSLATKVLELASDCFNLFDQESSAVLILSNNLFAALQMLISGDFHGDQNLSDIYQSINRYIQAIYQQGKNIDFNELVAGSLGYGISLMGPDESNRESIGVLLTKLPVFFNQLSEKIEYFSQKIAHKHSRDSAVVIQDFQKQTKLVLEQFSNLSLDGVSFSFDLFSLLNNCFRLWDFKNTLQSRLGLLQESYQRFILEHLRALKYQFFLPLFNAADDIELDLNLRTGEITEKLAPHVERFYWWLVYLTRDNIQFSGADQELLFLFDECWNHTRLHRTYRIYADSKLNLFQLRELSNILDKTQQSMRFQILDDSWKKNIPLFLPHVKKVDDEWYAKILHNPEDFKMQLGQERLTERLSQEVASLELKLQDIEAILAFIEFKEERLIHFIEWPKDWPIDLNIVERRFCGNYLLIHLADQYYFYDGVKKQIANIPSDSLKLFSKSQHPISSPNLLFRCTYNQQKNLESVIGRKIFNGHKRSKLEFSEPPLTSVLNSLADSEKYLKDIFLQKYFLYKAESMAREFFNFISTHATTYPKHALMQEWRDNLIRQRHHFVFTFEGRQDSLKPLLEAQQPMTMQELHERVFGEQAYVFGWIHHQKSQLLRQEKLVGVEYLRIFFEQNKARFNPEPIGARVGYFLNSTRGSDLCGLLKSKLQDCFEMYHPEARNFMCQTVDGYYSALLNDHKVILTFPKQVVDGMIIFNSLTLFENFFKKLEKLKKSEFADDIANVFTKIYLVIDYVSLQNYVMTQFRYTYHFQLLKKFYAKFCDIYDINKLPLSSYELIESDKLPKSSALSLVENWLYWFLNSPELVRLKIGEKALFNKEDNLEIIKSIRNIIGNVRSYIWLIFKLGFYDIYSLVSQLKNRLSNFNKVIYELTAINLYNLKPSLFAEFIFAIDDLEVDLGIHPKYFSDKVSSMIDVLFQHFIGALNLDLVKFSQLMMSEDIKVLRIKHFDEMLQKSSLKKSKHHETSQRLFQFLQIWKQVEQQRGVFANQDEIADTLKPFFMDIVSILIEFQSHRMPPTRPELMSASETFWDSKIDVWLNDSGFRDKIQSKDYINLVTSINQFMIGLENTEELKAKLFKSKKQHLLELPKAKLDDELKKYTARQFDNYFNHLQKKRQHVYLKMNNLYLNQLQEFFSSRKQDLVGKIHSKLLTEYHRKQTIQPSVPLHTSHLSQEYRCEFIKLIVDFNKTYNHHYLYLETVLEIIEKYERYLARVKTELMQGKGDWFENDKTVENKLQQLRKVSQLILNPKENLRERVMLVQKVLKENKDFKTIMLDHAELPVTGFVQYLLKLWQWLMLILIRFGFYEPEHHKVFNLLSDIKPSSEPIHFDEERFYIFNDLNVEKPSALESVSGVNLCAS